MDFRVEKGQVFSVIGGSGQGKSVLLKHLLGLLRPTSGHIYVDGEDVPALSGQPLYRLRDRFGYLFQSGALFDSMTVAENVGFAFRHNHKLRPAEIARKVADALEMVDLPGTERKKPSELSGGMRKRVGLARAIIYQPQILLYDEPTTGLHFADTQKLLDMLNQLVDAGNTVVVIEHNLDVIKTADWIIDLGPEGGDRGGEIVSQGTPEDVAAANGSYTGQFLKKIL